MRRLAPAALAALAFAAPAHAASPTPRLLDLHVDNGSTPYAGDGRLLTTISPNGDGFRDAAHVRFSLAEPATVTMEVTRTVKAPHVIWTSGPLHLRRGSHVITWRPAKLNPRTYLIRLFAYDARGRAVRYGAPNAFVGRYARGPVVRIQGIDAGFFRPSYAPGQVARIHVATDASQLTMRVFQSGPEQVVTYADNQMAGIEIDRAPVQIDMTRYQSRPRDILFRVPAVPSGLYYVQFGSSDGRIGYAPFVVRPVLLGAASRVLVVLPTNTWQAYNFQDDDGNGYGDTWYAGPPNLSVNLGRTYIARGVPPRFYRYDLPFLHWLYWSGKSAEFVSDSDFAEIPNGDALARAYDLIVFEGHEEYVTAHEYDDIQRYRDLGGNLMFLSADNFYWKVEQKGQVIRKVAAFRMIGRPEAGLIGVQYRANDNGRHQGLFTVENSASAPWLWDGTGLSDGSTFGQAVGGYGIEIDATTPQTPPGTIVLAEIPDLFGPGLTAQMTYYELPNGAKVFAAGALDFGGSATFSPIKQMLDNLWARLTVP
ncbi:MAG TPA: N,N-dimethylformamidase beta subunit family domain-containing protein [Gaiellaceae bacterium]|nr:N,N-dimethylformamidase beta subunit family domain-containing protein [Gaiellaceae bacterium]